MTFHDFLTQHKCPHGLVTSCKWCSHHNTFASSSLAVFGIGSSYILYNQWGIVPVVYILMVLLPLILGMAGKIGFKWVILWEIIMFLPIGIILLVFFGGAIISLFRRNS